MAKKTVTLTWLTADGPKDVLVPLASIDCVTNRMPTPTDPTRAVVWLKRPLACMSFMCSSFEYIHVMQTMQQIQKAWDKA